VKHSARINRRYVLGIFGGVASAGLLVACSQASPAAPAPTAPPAAAPTSSGATAPAPAPTTAPAAQPAASSQGPIQLTWARHGTEGDLTTENALGAAFAKANPGVTVKPQVLPFSDYSTKIPVMVAGGTAPDVFGAFPTLLIQVYGSKGVRSIDDAVKSAKDLNYDDFVYPGDGQFDGKIIGLPQKSCTHQLRYNKDLFKSAGLPTPTELYWKDKEKSWNWTNFVTMGKKLTQGNQYFFDGGGATFFLPLIRAAGGDIFSKDLKKSTLTAPEAKEALQFMSDLVLTDKIQPGPQMQAAKLGIDFPGGKLATAMGTTCDSVRDLRKGSELTFGWDFVVLPAGKAGFRCWGDTDQMVTSTTSKFPDVDFKWMQYRSSKEAWEQLYSQGIQLAFSDGPTRLSIFESKAFTEPLAAVDVKMIGEGYKYTIPNPFAPRAPQIDKILNTVMSMEIENMLRGTKTVDQAATDMSQQIDQILAKG
jgi:ABC-type glycerol-3-phosphate transport system substrate-binding protein